MKFKACTIFNHYKFIVVFSFCNINISQSPTSRKSGFVWKGCSLRNYVDKNVSMFTPFYNKIVQLQVFMRMQKLDHSCQILQMTAITITLPDSNMAWSPNQPKSPDATRKGPVILHFPECCIEMYSKILKVETLSNDMFFGPM